MSGPSYYKKIISKKPIILPPDIYKKKGTSHSSLEEKQNGTKVNALVQLGKRLRDKSISHHIA